MSCKGTQDLVTTAAVYFQVGKGQGEHGEASLSEPRERKSAEAEDTVLPYLKMTE